MIKKPASNKTILLTKRTIKFVKGIQKSRTYIYISSLLICLLAHDLLAANKKNTPLCKTLLSNDQGQRKGLADFADLPPHHLDLDNPYDSILSLIDEVGELSSDFQALKKLDLKDPKSLAEFKSVRYEVDELKRQIEGNSIEAINQLNPLVPKQRKILEGHHILNTRVSNLKNKYNDLFNEIKNLSEEEADQVLEQKTDAEELGNKKADLTNSLDEKLKKILSDISNDLTEQDQYDKHEENTNNSEISTSEQDSKSEEKRQELVKLLNDLQTETEKPTAPPISDASTQPDVEDQKNQPSASGSADEQSESSDAATDSQPSASGSADEQSESSDSATDSQPSASSGADEQSESSDAATDSQPSASSGADEQSESSDAATDSQPSASGNADAQSESNSAGDGHLGQTIEKFMRNLIEKKALESSFLKDAVEDPYLSKLNNDHEVKDYLNNQHEQKSDEDLPVENEEIKAEQYSESSKELNSLDQLSEEQLSALIKSYLEFLWEKTVSEYGNSTSYKKALTDFFVIADELFIKFPKQLLINQYHAQASQLLEQVNLYNVTYKSLEELSLSVIKMEPNSEVSFLRKLKYLEKVLSVVDTTRMLTFSEQRLIDYTRQIISNFDLDSTATDKEIGEAFYDLMGGPISRNNLNKKFPSSNSRDPIDWHNLVKSIKSGLLNHFVLISRMSPYVDILMNETFKPYNLNRPIGEFESMNESDSVIKELGDLDDLPQMIKEGFPIEIEVLRAISGDAAMNAYRKPVNTTEPKKPISNKVTIVLYDVSGSMKGYGDLIRNSIMAKFLDKSQIEVINEEASHTVYLTPFDTQPLSTERLSHINQVQAYYDKLEDFPTKGNAGTSITAAIVYAFELIAQHQNEGGELERANIFLITDGKNKIDRQSIDESKKKVDPATEIAFNIVTLGNWNSGIIDLVEDYSSIQTGRSLAKTSHQHISSLSMKNYLAVQLYIKALEEVAAINDNRINVKLPNREYIKFKKLLTRINTDNDTLRLRGTTTANNLIRKLSKPNNTTSNENINAVLKLFYRFAITSIPERWGQNEKSAALLTFMELISNTYEVDVDSILALIRNEDREHLLKWLK